MDETTMSIISSICRALAPLFYVLSTIVTFLLFFGPPIAMIVTVIVVISIVVKNNKKKKEEESKKLADLEQQKKRDAEKKRQGEQVLANTLTEKYKDNPITIKAAEKFAKEFIKDIKSIHRDIRDPKITCEKSLGATIDMRDGAVCTKVGYVSAKSSSIYSYNSDGYRFSYCWGEILDFVYENLRPLQNRIEMEAFVRAIAIRAYDIIKDQYTKDESGTDCQITMKEFSGADYDRHGISIKFMYSADNGFYSAPTEW